MNKLIDKKVANTLYTDANIHSGHSGGVHLLALLFKTIMGGLWVGGTAYIYDDYFNFKPNKLNENLHENLSGKKIPIHKIIDVTVRKGVLTKIIDLKMADGTLSIRCFDAYNFAASLQNLINK